MLLRCTAVMMAVAFTGCGGGSQVAQVAEQDESEPVPVVLPAGDAIAGRQAFLDLKCTVCHAVPAETDFPSPFSASMGPALGTRVASQGLSDLAAAIVTPSHALSESMNEDVRSELAGTLSPMGDFSQVMTVRQLVDLVAYLRSLG